MARAYRDSVIGRRRVDTLRPGAQQLQLRRLQLMPNRAALFCLYPSRSAVYVYTMTASFRLR